MSEKKPNEYPITTLEDIYKLPTADMVQRCLTEISQGVYQARLQNDMLSQAYTPDEPFPVELTLPVTWIDDNKNEHTHQYHVKGEKVMTITNHSNT